MRAFVFALVLLLGACAEGLGMREPILFGDGDGGGFAVADVVVLAGDGTRSAVLPPFPPSPVSEERVDLSGTPLLGQVFKQRFGPADIEDNGLPLGPVYRSGDVLIVDLRRQEQPFQAVPVVLSSEIDGLGAISYRLGRLDFVETASPQGTGRQIGFAYLLGSTLALVADGERPAIRDLSRPFDSL